MSAATLVERRGGMALWHVTVDLAYEGSVNDSCQDGIDRVKKALNPLIENGSGLKQIYIMRLPQKD